MTVWLNSAIDRLNRIGFKQLSTHKLQPGYWLPKKQLLFYKKDSCNMQESFQLPF